MQPISMRDHFFLHYGWFFQNLRKEAVRTFMHTTVVYGRPTASLRSYEYSQNNKLCNDKIHYKTIILYLNCKNKKTLKSAFKCMQTSPNNLKLSEIYF